MTNFVHRNTPTRWPKGLTNNDPRHILGRIKGPDPHKSHYYGNDFNDFNSGDWTQTTVGTGTAALVAGDGGLLALTNSAANSDSVILTKLPAAFLLAAGFQTWFRMSLQLSDISASVLMAGLVNAVTTFAPTDGFWVSKANGTSALVANSREASDTAQTATLAAAGSIVNSTLFTVGFYYDGITTLQYAFNDAVVGSFQINTTANPLSTVNLTPAFGVQNGAAAAKVLTADFIFAAKDRSDNVAVLP